MSDATQGVKSYILTDDTLSYIADDELDGVYDSEKSRLMAAMRRVRHQYENIHTWNEARLFRRIAELQAPATSPLSAPTDDLAKWQGYLDTIAELRAQLRQAQQATLSGQTVVVLKEAMSEYYERTGYQYWPTLDAASEELDRIYGGKP